MQPISKLKEVRIEKLNKSRKKLSGVWLGKGGGGDTSHIFEIIQLSDKTLGLI